MSSQYHRDKEYLFEIQLKLTDVIDKAAKAGNPIENGILSHQALISEMKDTIQLGFERKVAKYIHNLHHKLGYDKSHRIFNVKTFFLHHHDIDEEKCREMVGRNFKNFIDQQRFRDLFTIAGTQLTFNKIPEKREYGSSTLRPMKEMPECERRSPAPGPKRPTTLEKSKRLFSQDLEEIFTPASGQTWGDKLDETLTPCCIKRKKRDIKII
uniref:Myb_DNA-bind_3 domain-containing protein n=1 Tax=Strongyloides papillosus TaxID=174720 RepID=A0A0N5CCN2_STREA